MDQPEEPFPPTALLSTSQISSGLHRRPSDVDELEKEVHHHSPFALVPAVLTPSRLPSNTLITASRMAFFKAPVLLDFASEQPILEWYEGQKNNGSTLIEKLQLRRDLLPPYYHEYIMVFTQGSHTYRVDRRPDPDSPFDTIMRAGCKPYDTIQAVDSRSWREIEKASDCVVELTWYEKPKVDLLFVLSICFALRQDEHAKQYTLQRYNCYFLSWAIIMMVVRAKEDWETPLGNVMSELLQPPRIRKENYSVMHGVGLGWKAWQHGRNALTLRQHLKDCSGHHMELALARALVRALAQIRAQLRIAPSCSPALALALTMANALDPALNPSLVRALRWVLAEAWKLADQPALLQAQERVRVLKRKLAKRREQQRMLERESEDTLERMRMQMHRVGPMRVLPWEWEQMARNLQKLRDRLRQKLGELEQELDQKTAWRLGFELKISALLDRALSRVQKLKLHLVRLVLQESAVSTLLFPEGLYKWQSMMWDIQRRPLPKPMSGHVLVAHWYVGEEAEALARSMQFTTDSLFHRPSLPSITLVHKDANRDKAKISNTTCKATYPKLEQYMMKVLANHARRVARWGLASAAEVQYDMLKGMERIWLSVLQHSAHS